MSFKFVSTTKGVEERIEEALIQEGFTPDMFPNTFINFYKDGICAVYENPKDLMDDNKVMIRLRDVGIFDKDTLNEQIQNFSAMFVTFDTVCKELAECLSESRDACEMYNMSRFCYEKFVMEEKFIKVLFVDRLKDAPGGIHNLVWMSFYAYQFLQPSGFTIKGLVKQLLFREKNHRRMDEVNKKKEDTEPKFKIGDTFTKKFTRDTIPLKIISVTQVGPNEPVYELSPIRLCGDNVEMGETALMERYNKIN